MKKSTAFEEFLSENYTEKFRELKSEKKSLLSLRKRLLYIKNDMENSASRSIKEKKYITAEEYIAQLRKMDNYIENLDELVELLDYRDDFVFEARIYDNLPDLIKNMNEHYLDENFEDKNPIAFKLNDRIYRVENWRELLIKTCRMLIERDRELFKDFLKYDNFKNKSQYYFSRTESKVSSAVDLRIGDQIIYIYMSFSRDNITNLIAELLKKYKINLKEYKIYLKEEYHNKVEMTFQQNFERLP